MPLAGILQRTWAMTLLVGVCAIANAADKYPSRPVRLIVPYAPGGNADLVGRLVAEGLTTRLGVQFVVDNRPGASSIIGTELAAKAPPDGHTILLVASTVAVNPSLVAKLPYDTLRDLVPLSLVAQTPQVLLVTPSLPVQSLKDLIALAKAKPRSLNYGSTGVGSTANMAGALLNSMAGIQLVHVPYKATAQSLTDVMAGLDGAARHAATDSGPAESRKSPPRCELRKPRIAIVRLGRKRSAARRRSSVSFCAPRSTSTQE